MRISVCTPHPSSSLLRIISSLVVCSLFILLWTTSTVSAQSVEWSEKDLARNVHRAEESFEAGEMSRSYGLFAHLVSIAGDRAFLHFRFGSICTYTSKHLEEAEEHLMWAEDLGILGTEHAAEWHYYLGRVHHLRYEFNEAAEHYRLAIDTGKSKQAWMNDAKLFYGQCITERPEKIDAINLSIRSTLSSHSDDFFRLIEMSIHDGRILNTPEALRSKHDLRMGYVSTMHWLPSHRFAFYASYGQKGNTGLDIYRVSVDGMGEYGTPERLPFPINSDFDDCAPICISSDDNTETAGQLYFSSSRPESFGGYDIFQSNGWFFEPAIGLSDNLKATHLPYGINSTSDEWLYYTSLKNESRWLATNRKQDFEGKEIWEFDGNLESVVPIAIRLELPEASPSGRLIVKKEGSDAELITLESDHEAAIDFMVENGVNLTLSWKDKNGVSQWTEALSIPEATNSKIAMEPLAVGITDAGTFGILTRPSTYIEEPSLSWSENAMGMNQRSGTWLEPVDAEMAYQMRRQNSEPADIQRILLAEESEITGETTTGVKAIPNWVLNALEEIESINADNRPLTASIMRSKALILQNNMEVIQCWDAPGSIDWKLQVAIKRYGEPALGLLSEETRMLEETSERNVRQWKQWLNKVNTHIAGKVNISQDWLMLSDYLRAQAKANESALAQIQDMYRRIEAHLVYDRWVTEALPMSMPEFREHLLQITAQNQDVLNSVQLAATCGPDEPDSSNQRWIKVQELLWRALSESIVEVQELGVFDLPNMKDAQSWFIRSGGLLEDAEKSGSPQEQLVRGQAAVGLAWETFHKGASKRDRVERETHMTDSEWWSNFGATRHNTKDDYGDFDVFSSNNAPIVQQAELYLEELDVIRTKTPKTDGYKASMSQAIALRSSLENQLQTLFGGSTSRETPRSTPSQVQVRKVSEKVAKSTFEIANAAQSLSTTIKNIDAPAPPKTKPETISKNSELEDFQYTIQIGAFSSWPKDDLKWYASSTKIKSDNGIIRCFIGTFDGPSEANDFLNVIQVDIPDAFISKVPRDISISSPAKQSTQPTNLSEVDHTDSSSGNFQQFRLKICTVTAAMNSADKARLMRLGNEIPLVSRHVGNATAYYSKTYTNFADAEEALKTCKRRGFSDASLQILN